MAAAEKLLTSAILVEGRASRPSGRAGAPGSPSARLGTTIDTQFRWCNSRGGKAELLASSGVSNNSMETAETRNGHHWSLTLLGIALVIMFAYYGESVL